MRRGGSTTLFLLPNHIISTSEPQSLYFSPVPPLNPFPSLFSPLTVQLWGIVSVFFNMAKLGHKFNGI